MAPFLMVSILILFNTQTRVRKHFLPIHTLNWMQKISNIYLSPNENTSS